MVGKHSLRQAGMADRDALAALKAAYVRSLYRGFVPQEKLKALDPTPYQSVLGTALEAPGRQVIIMDEEGQPQGFVVLGADPDEAGYGMIFDVAMRPGGDPLLRDELLAGAVERLMRQGMRRIHVWILRDNFRVRFLFEQFGFKAEGVRRTVERGGQELQVTRYLFRAPEEACEDF